MCSAKSGEGVQNILEAVIEKIPPPAGKESAALQALIFDSWFDPYQGVVCLIRVVNGKMKKGDHLLFWGTKKKSEILKLGIFTPRPTEVQELGVGEVGFLITGVKDIHETKIGDTVTHVKKACSKPLPGFRQVKPMVFCGIYPIQSDQYEILKEALEKLSLNDSSFSFEPETSMALGFGFRCGFLGLLHMEIIQERLEREYTLELLGTSPTVAYKVTLNSGKTISIDNPSQLPDPNHMEKIEEPYINAHIHTPSEFIGNIIQLCEKKRGIQMRIDYLTTERVLIHYQIPFPEIMFDFYDRLKSMTKGYASLDYDFTDYREAELAKLDILVNGDPVDALSVIVHKEQAYYRGRALTEKLRVLIPRQQYDVAIQAAIGGHIIARETVKALRKDVTAKCYGGDITRKRKLLEKQKKGKKRMKQVGSVEIPQEAFLAVLKID